MPSKANNRKIREILDVARMTRLEFRAQVILLGLTCAIAYGATGLVFIPLWLMTHYALLGVERFVTWRLRDSESRAGLLWVLFAHLLVGINFAVMPVYLWHHGGDAYKFAAMVLFVASTLNTFLVRSQLWFMALCFVGPNSLAVLAIAVLVARGAESRAEAGAVLVTALAIVAYLAIAILQAMRSHGRYLETREQLAQAQKMEAVGNLAGGMAHDFNNILNVILGTLELAEEETDPARMRASLGRVRDAALRGASLIRQVLSFARRSHLAPQRVEPDRIVAEVEQMARRLISAQIALEFSTAADVGTIRVDEATLVTALLNLVLNARDAIEGAGRIRLCCTRVPEGPGGRQAGPQVVFSVHDTGRGIPHALIDRVTDPFFTTKRKGEGTGLGLSMVAGFAAQSGGELRITSTEGQGTLAQIFLPADPDAEALPPEPVPEAAPAPVPALVPVAASPARTSAPRRILVVEDQRELLEILSRFLTRCGHEVHAAQSGDAAAALIDQGLRPEIVVSDVVMPGAVQGRDLARIIRNRLPATRIVLMSGFDESEFGPDPAETGRDVFLAKPVRLADLAETIRSLDAADDRPPVTPLCREAAPAL